MRSESKFWSNGSVPWFTVEDIRNQGKVIYSTQQHITEEAITTDRIVPANSFLLCCTASVGVYAQTKIALTTNQQFNALTVKNSHKDLLIDEYLFGIGEYFSSLLHSAAGKTTFEFVSVKKLGAFLIPVPPKKEQQRIIDALQEFDPILKEYDKLEQQTTKLDGEIYDKLKKSILQYAIQGKLVEQDENDEPVSVLLERIRSEKKAQLGKKYVESYIYKGDDNCYYEHIDGKDVNITEEIPFDLPENWCWSRLDSVISIVSDGTHKTPNYVEKGIPFLSVQNISSGKLDLSKIKYITEQEHKQLIKRVEPKVDDILLCRIGTLGKAIKITWTFEFSIFVSLGLLRVIDKNIIDFLVMLINSPYGDKWISENKVGGGTHTFKINLNSIPNMLLPIPPLAEQKRIVDKINEIFAKL